MRVFAFSDLHVDYAPNLACITALSRSDYRHDVLLLGGDVSDHDTLLARTLALLRARFARVFFVPGNHELWDRRRRHAHALDRFTAVLQIARSEGLDTAPATVGEGAAALRIMPLFSWYRRPHEGASTLYLPKAGEFAHPGWADDRFVHWPAGAAPPADHFLALNEAHIRRYPQPVLSFSHFLPRAELMFAPPGTRRPGDPHPRFNFSRVAGCTLLDGQIRRLGARVHVYGHQHRNRRRLLDGVHYLSHCLGYPRERAHGYLSADAARPLCIWDDAAGGLQSHD